MVGNNIHTVTSVNAKAVRLRLSEGQDRLRALLITSMGNAIAKQ
jgi:hypothetical protein